MALGVTPTKAKRATLKRPNSKAAWAAMRYTFCDRRGCTALAAITRRNGKGYARRCMDHI